VVLPALRIGIAPWAHAIADEELKQHNFYCPFSDGSLPPPQIIFARKMKFISLKSEQKNPKSRGGEGEKADAKNRRKRISCWSLNSINFSFVCRNEWARVDLQPQTRRARKVFSARFSLVPVLLDYNLINQNPFHGAGGWRPTRTDCCGIWGGCEWNFIWGFLSKPLVAAFFAFVALSEIESHELLKRLLFASTQ
jgi:hypothetical protein